MKDPAEDLKRSNSPMGCNFLYVWCIMFENDISLRCFVHFINQHGDEHVGQWLLQTSYKMTYFLHQTHFLKRPTWNKSLQPPLLRPIRVLADESWYSPSFQNSKCRFFPQYFFLMSSRMNPNFLICFL